MKEQQEEDRRRKLEELKQHVRNKESLLTFIIYLFKFF